MLGDPPSWGLSPITGLHPLPGPDQSHPKWGGEESINYILNIGRGGWENKVVHVSAAYTEFCRLPLAYFCNATDIFVLNKTSAFQVSNQVIRNNLRSILFTIYLDGLFKSL